MKFFVSVFVIAGIAAAQPAHSTTLLTSATGYTGPSLIIPAQYGFDFTYGNGPVLLGNGITFSSDAPNSSSIGTGDYGFDANGNSLTSTLIGLEDGTSTITLTFAVPVMSFGLNVNYAVTSSNVPVGADPVIRAYNASNILIASYDIEELAPIRTPGGVDQFAFRGITSTDGAIASFQLSGAYIAAQGQLANVPEPATWAVLLVGLAGIAVVSRRTTRG